MLSVDHYELLCKNLGSQAEGSVLDQCWVSDEVSRDGGSGTSVSMFYLRLA